MPNKKKISQRKWKYIIPILVYLTIVTIVVVLSWIFIPGWNSITSVILLISAAAVGVLTFLKDFVSYLKEWVGINDTDYDNKDNSKELNNEQIDIHSKIHQHLSWMQERFGKIEIRGIKKEDLSVLSLDLNATFVPLETMSQDRKKVLIKEIPSIGKNIVITGGPGSGKSTVLQYFAWTIAYSLLRSEPDFAKDKLGVDVVLPNETEEESKAISGNTNYKTSTLIPIYVPLSSYAQYLNSNQVGVINFENQSFSKFISYYLNSRQANYILGDNFFVELLRNNYRILLLLDGLDEVPIESDRIRIRQIIEDLSAGKENITIYVTSRSIAYQGLAMFGQSFRHIRVLPLEEHDIEKIIFNMYNTIYEDASHETAKQKTKDLMKQIERIETERIRRMGNRSQKFVVSPLIVRLLILLHFNGGELPFHRVDLYQKVLTALLDPDYVLDTEIARMIASNIGGNPKTHLGIHQYVAFKMHLLGEDSGIEIDEKKLINICNSSPEYFPFLKDWLQLIQYRGTIIEERDHSYRFIHLSFQEFLTARYISELYDEIDEIIVFFEKRILDTWWHEVFMLLIGYLISKYPKRAIALLEKILKNLNMDVVESGMVVLAEIGILTFLEWQLELPQLQYLAKPSVNLILKKEIANTRRLNFVDNVGILGDPRFNLDAFFLVDEENFGFIEIPDGEFIMGKSALAPDDELEDSDPQHTLWLPKFYICRFPVTNAQFRLFAYETAWKPNNRFLDQHIPNHPVVRVNWFDAIDYCLWLNEKLIKQFQYFSNHPIWGKLITREFRIMIPSEPEWEKAAKYSNTNSHINNPNIYPWGNDFKHEYTNMLDSGIAGTNAVGAFPNGNTNLGIADMAGNVWEWTRSKWVTYPYPSDADNILAVEEVQSKNEGLRVLRGGAFSSQKNSLECVSRLGYGPHSVGGDFGFRLVITPSQIYPYSNGLKPSV